MQVLIALLNWQTSYLLTYLLTYLMLRQSKQWRLSIIQKIRINNTVNAGSLFHCWLVCLARLCSWQLLRVATTVTKRVLILVTYIYNRFILSVNWRQLAYFRQRGKQKSVDWYRFTASSDNVSIYWFDFVILHASETSKFKIERSKQLYHNNIHFLCFPICRN